MRVNEARIGPGTVEQAPSLAALLPAEERQAFEAALLPPRSCAAGRDIVREGGGVDQIVFMTAGWACRYKSTRDGGRQVVAVLLPGDAANLDMLVFDEPDYGVRALTEVSTAALPRQRALALAAEHPGVARALTRLAFTETAVLGQWTLCLGRFSAQQRLAHLLCELSARLGGRASGTTSFRLPLTQEQIADALGLTSVHVNRTFQQLRGEGYVSTDGRTLTITDVARLRQLGEFDPRYLHRES